MGNVKKPSQPPAAGGDNELFAVRKTQKYFYYQDLLTRVAKKKSERRRARRYSIDTVMLEADGEPIKGWRIIDLSVNGARLAMPFSPPFMNQLVLRFRLPQSPKILSMVGRIIWSKKISQSNEFEIGLQFYQNYWEIDQLLQQETR